MRLEKGIKKTMVDMVTEDNTALKMGSGELLVLATPYLICLMEKCSAMLSKEYLDENQTTVGTKVNIEHIAASPVGSKITINSVVKKIEGRKIIFEVEAYDEKEKIGFGTHERFIVDSKKFFEKVNNKKNG